MRKTQSSRNSWEGTNLFPPLVAPFELFLLLSVRLPQPPVVRTQQLHLGVGGPEPLHLRLDLDNLSLPLSQCLLQAFGGGPEPPYLGLKLDALGC